MKKMNMADIDRQIIQIQRSTRTTFRPFNPMHNSLRMKYPWYYRWHLWTGASYVHIGFLLLYVVGLAIAVTSFGFLSYKTVNPTKIKAEGENVVKAYNVTGAGVVGADGYYIGTNGGPYTSAASVEIIKVGSDWKLADDFYKTAAATPEGGGWGEAISPAPTVTANGSNYIVSDAGYTDCNGEYAPDGFGSYVFNVICRITSNSGWDLTVDSALYGGPVVLYHTAAGSPDGGGWSVSFDPSPIPTVTAVDAYIDVSGAGVGDANGTYVIDTTDTWTWGKPGYVKGDWYLSYVTNPQYSINGPDCSPMPGCYSNGADTPTGGTWDMYGAPGAAPSSVTISGAGYLVAGAGIVDLNGQYDPVGGGHYSNGGDGDLYQDAGVWYIGGMMTSPPKTYSNSAATPDQGSWSVVHAPAPTVTQGTPPAATYKISGTILDGSNNPVVGVSVSDGTDTDATDVNGYYELVDEVDDDYTITPTLETYTFSPTNRNVTVSGADVANVDFTADLIDCVQSSGSGRDDMTSGTWGTKVAWGDGAYRCTDGNCHTGWGQSSPDIIACQGPYIWKNGGNWKMTGCLNDGISAYESSVGLISQWNLNSWDAPPPLVESCGAPVTTIDISGTAKQYDESTNAADGETVKVAVNGVLQAQTGATATGAWTIAGVTAPTSGDIITVFIDGVADTNEANAVTKYDGTGDITGVELYEKHLSIGSVDNQTLSNADLSQYDYSVSSDEDIFFDIDGSNNLTLPAPGTQTDTDQKLIIKASNTWRPASAGGTTSTVPKIYTPDSATTMLDNNILKLTGSGQGVNRPLKVGTSGTFDTDTSTVSYEGSAATDIASIGFYNLILNYSGTTFTPYINFAVSGIFTINAGNIFNGDDGIITLSGSDTPFVVNGTFQEATSTFRYTGSSATNVTGTTYYNLTLNHSGTTFTSGGSITAKNILTLASGTFDTKSGSNYPLIIGTTSNVGSYTQTNGIFNANNSTILCYGDYLVTGGIYNAGGSTLTFDATPGNLDWNTANYTLNQVRFQSTSVGNTRNITTTAGTFGIAGSLMETTIANSEPVLIKADINNTNFNIGGSISMYDSAYGINFGNGTWNIHGGFRLPYNSEFSHLNQSTINFTGSGLIYSDSHSCTQTTNFYNVRFSGNYTIERLTYNNLLTVDSGKTLTSTYSFGACGNASTNNNGTITGAEGQVMVFNENSPANISTAGVFDINVRFAQNTSNVVSRNYGRSVYFYAHSCGMTPTWTLGTATGQTFDIGRNFYITNDSGCSPMVVDTSIYNPNINIGGSIGFTGKTTKARDLKAGSGTWSVGGNINLTNISLNAGSSLFSLNGNNAQTITSAGNSFNNLRVDSGTSGSVIFADNATLVGTFTDLVGDSVVVFNAGSTFNFAALDIGGLANQNINLRSSIEGSQWNFNVSEVNPTVCYVNVKDSNASGGNKIVACESGADLGNNLNWDFCTPAPNPADTCVLGDIAQVAIKPLTVTLLPGATQLMGIDFKDAQGNLISKESVTGFNITPDFSNSFWSLTAGGGALQNENIAAIQIDFLAGNTDGEFSDSINFSACGGILKASATPIINSNPECPAIPACEGNMSLVDNGLDLNGCHIWECQSNGGGDGGGGGDEPFKKTIIVLNDIATGPISSPLATAMAGLGLLTLSLALPLASSTAISSGAQLLNYLSFLKARAFIFLGIGGKRTRWGVVFDNSTKKPLSFARVALYSWPDNKLREITVSNQVGEFNFLTPPGKYYIVASLAGFKHLKPDSKSKVKGEIRYVPGRTDAYYDNLYYQGEVISILSEEQQKSLIDISLPLEQVSEKKKAFLLSLSTFWYNFVKVVNQIHLPLLIIGTLLAIILLIFRHNIIDWIIIALYIVLWILECYRFLYSGKAPGKVYDSKTNKILDRVLLRIVDSKTADIKGVFVTSRDGQFIFTPPPGVYTISAVREGYEPYFSPAFLVRNLSQLSGFRVKMTPSKEWKK